MVLAMAAGVGHVAWWMAAHNIIAALRSDESREGLERGGWDGFGLRAHSQVATRPGPADLQGGSWFAFV